MTTTRSGQQASKPAAKPAAQTATAPTSTSAIPAKELVAETQKRQDETAVVVLQQEGEVRPTEEQPAGGTDKKDFTTDDRMVIAQIGEVDRQGRVELRTGNLAYLKTRHQIGELLEKNYGGKTRLERGKQIVKEVSRRYDISTSELYRCWKFYKLRPDIDAFLDEFPDKDSWTSVKELLPSLEGGDVEEKRKKHEHQALIERINDDLKALRKGLTGDLRENVPPSELRELANQLRDSSQEVVALVIAVRPVTSLEQPSSVPEEAATT